MKKIILGLILLISFAFPQHTSQYILNKVFVSDSKIEGRIISEQAVFNAIFDSENDALQIRVVGGDSFSLTSDLDTLKFDLDVALYVIDLEINNTRVFSVDSLGNIISIVQIQAEHLYSTDDAVIDDDLTVGGDVIINGTTSFPSGYTRHIDLQIGAATLGPNAPTATTVGTFRGLGFDADNEEAFVNFEIPSDWDGASDMTFELHWYSTSGDAIANSETVKWDITYRSIAEGEAVDNGTVVSVTATFTGGASEADKEHYETSLTIDYDNANQPLVVGDDLGIQFDRDVTGDSYTGAGIVYRIDLTYTSNALPEN